MLLLTASFSATVAGFMLAPVLINMSLTVSMKREANLLERIMDGPEGEACRANPDSWRLEASDGTRLRAFDMREVQDSGDVANGPDPQLFQRLVSGESRSARLFVTGDLDGVLLLRLSEGGPCSVVEVRWPKKSSDRSENFALMLGLMFFAVTLAGGLGGAAVIMPLLRHLQEEDSPADQLHS